MLATSLVENWELLVFFGCIAVLYASVGFGGGSSYLAILTLYGVEFRSMRAIALLCNIVVVTGGCYVFYKKGYLKFRKIIPLVFASVPMAFLGGSLRISEGFFFVLLGIVLIGAAIMMFVQAWMLNENELIDTGSADRSSFKEPAIGGTIGLLSGIVGIGGGIFLSPTLYLSKWDSAKVIAATCSFFILVNSFSGLLGQLTHGFSEIDWKLAVSLMGCVLVGGQIGSRMGAIYLTRNLVRILTACLILVVGIQILLK